MSLSSKVSTQEANVIRNYRGVATACNSELFYGAEVGYSAQSCEKPKLQAVLKASAAAPSDRQQTGIAARTASAIYALCKGGRVLSELDEPGSMGLGWQHAFDIWDSLLQNGGLITYDKICYPNHSGSVLSSNRSNSPWVVRRRDVKTLAAVSASNRSRAVVSSGTGISRPRECCHCRWRCGHCRRSSRCLRGY